MEPPSPRTSHLGTSPPPFFTAGGYFTLTDEFGIFVTPACAATLVCLPGWVFIRRSN